MLDRVNLKLIGDAFEYVNCVWQLPSNISRIFHSHSLATANAKQEPLTVETRRLCFRLEEQSGKFLVIRVSRFKLCVEFRGSGVKLETIRKMPGSRTDQNSGRPILVVRIRKIESL